MEDLGWRMLDVLAFRNETREDALQCGGKDFIELGGRMKKDSIGFFFRPDPLAR